MSDNHSDQHSVVDIITSKLEKALAPASLEVINESHLHSGHAGSPGTGESHFRVKVTSSEFVEKSRLQIHQTINKILAEELEGKIHALAIEAKAP
jgi:BolA protein